MKASVRKLGATLSELSKAIGRTPNACNQALRRPWPYCEEAIAALLQVKPWEVWPSRYSADHRPIGPKRVHFPKDEAQKARRLARNYARTLASRVARAA